MDLKALLMALKAGGGDMARGAGQGIGQGLGRIGSAGVMAGGEGKLAGVLQKLGMLAHKGGRMASENPGAAGALGGLGLINAGALGEVGMQKAAHSLIGSQGDDDDDDDYLAALDKAKKRRMGVE